MKRKASFIKVEHQAGGGLFLPEADLWLDPGRSRPRAFVSHAHSDHFAPHQRLFCSTGTAALIAGRYGGNGEVVARSFGQSWEEGGFRYRLLPAGHVFGSAQLHLERLSDGASLLYTGDFKLRPDPVAEATEWAAADTLIMETTFGLPRYVMPPAAEVEEAIRRFAVETLEDGEVPVLLGYSLGKAQEIHALLAGLELPVTLHSSVAAMTRIYEAQGYEFPAYEVWDGKAPLSDGGGADGRVFIVPPAAVRSRAMQAIKHRRVAMVTGWGVDGGARFRYQVDEVLPLSDHADYPDLLRYVELVDPALVLTVHGFAREFAQDLRERGREAWAIGCEEQVELNLGAGRGEVSAGEAAEVAVGGEECDDRPGGSFAAWAELAEQIAGTTGKRKKSALLAEYFRGLEPGEVEIAARFLAGKPLPRAAGPGHVHGPRALGAGWAVMRRALLGAAGVSEARYQAISQSQNDASRTAYLVLSEGRKAGEPAEAASLERVAAFFQDLAAARGPSAKEALLREIFIALHPGHARALVSVFTGDLRIGLKEGLLEDALAEAFGVEAPTMREAHMLAGDIGETARLAAEGRLGEVSIRPFTPITCMLASPGETAADLWKRLGDRGEVWIEDKFDGIRAQLHRAGGEVEIFSRDLRALGGEFPEIIERAKGIDHEVILDGEIIAFAAGRRLSFFDLQKRLGRNKLIEHDLFFGESIPVEFRVFDLLWHDGRGLLKEPLEERRKLLDGLSLPPQIEAVPVTWVLSAAALDEEFRAARLRGNEGLIAKDPASEYGPGRRGKAWLKLKKAFATLDVVVVRAEQGHGKRAHVLSDYTFAVRDEAGGNALRVIGKAYSGLTDDEIEELTEHFEATTTAKKRRAREVTPEIVLEVAFDSIHPSGRHDSGLAMRFSRIKSIRRDKGPEEIDTLAYARKLAGL